MNEQKIVDWEKPDMDAQDLERIAKPPFSGAGNAKLREALAEARAARVGRGITLLIAVILVSFATGAIFRLLAGAC